VYIDVAQEKHQQESGWECGNEEKDDADYQRSDHVGILSVLAVALPIRSARQGSARCRIVRLFARAGQLFSLADDRSSSSGSMPRPGPALDPHYLNDPAPLRRAVQAPSRREPRVPIEQL
jgi:hypothetical protein